MRTETAEKKNKKAPKRVVPSIMEEPKSDEIVFEDENDALDYDDHALATDEFHEELPDDAELAGAFDIFDHCGDLAEKGNAVKYTIKKNGEFLCTKLHPYSWAQLQKEFKGGQYTVIAKSMTTNRYLKQQVQSMSDPVREEADEPRYQRPPEPQQPQQPNIIEILTVLHKMSEPKHTDSSSSNQMMLLMMEMNKSQTEQARIASENQSKMMLEIAKMNQTASEKMAEAQTKMFEKMESRFEKIVDVIQTKGKKEDGLSSVELIKMLDGARNSGMELFNQMSELAEAKAEERLALIQDSDSGKGEKPSMTERLVESVLPMIATAVTKAQTPAPQAPAPRRAVQKISGAERRNIPAPTKQSNPAPQRAQASTAQTGSGDAGRINRETAQVKHSQGLTSVVFAEEPTSENVVEAAPQPVSNVSDTGTMVFNKAQTIEMLTPIIAEQLIGGASPEQGAAKIIDFFKLNNISLKKTLENVSKNDILELVAANNLPEEANGWFEGFYADLETRARMDAR